MSENCVRWRNGFASFSQVHPSRKKKNHFKADLFCISLANLTSLACGNLRANLISTKVSEKLAQVHARSGQTKSQVDSSF